MQLSLAIKELSDLIVIIASIVGSLYAIWTKFVLPATNFGKQKLAKRQKQQDEKTLELIKTTTKEVIDPITESIEGIKHNINEITFLNAEQTGKIESLEKKIDGNEIDRIRWELFQFARMCRAGAEPPHKEFEHIFELHDKYKKLINDNGLTNGQMDMEYDFVKKYYLEVCAKNAQNLSK